MGLAERGLAQADVRRLYHNWHLDSRRDSERRVSTCWQSPANTARLLLCTNNWIFLFLCHSIPFTPTLFHHSDIKPRLNPDYLFEWSHCVRPTQISQEIITLSGWTNNTELKTERTLSIPLQTVFIGWKNTSGKKQTNKQKQFCHYLLTLMAGQPCMALSLMRNTK